MRIDRILELSTKDFPVEVVKLGKRYKVTCAGLPIRVKDVSFRGSRLGLQISSRSNATGEFVDISSSKEGLASLSASEYKALFDAADARHTRRSAEERWDLAVAELQEVADGRKDLLLKSIEPGVKMGQPPAGTWSREVSVTDDQAVSSWLKDQLVTFPTDEDAQDVQALFTMAADSYAAALGT